MDIQILCKLGHQSAALYVEFCHECAVGSVETGMDNGTVCLGGAAAHILFPLHHQNIRFPAGQLPGNGTAGNACAYDNDICHAEFNSSFGFGGFTPRGREAQSPPGGNGDHPALSVLN